MHSKKARFTADELSNPEYHSQAWAVSSSFLKDMWTHSPAYAKARRDNPKTAPSLAFGTALHALVLEGEAKYRASVVDAKYKTGKKAEAERKEAEAEGKVALHPDEQALAEKMHDAILRHEYATELLYAVESVEESFFWKDEKTGVWCRCRPDARTVFETIDLKTCADLYRFEKDAFDYGYLLQAAFYRRGIEAHLGARPDFLFIAVDKQDAPNVGVFRYDDEALRAADEAIDRLLASYSDCESANVWPTGFEQERNMYLKPWQERRLGAGPANPGASAPVEEDAENEEAAEAPIINQKEAARLIGTSHQNVAAFRKKGVLRTVTVAGAPSRSVLYLRSDVERVAEAYRLLHPNK